MTNDTTIRTITTGDAATTAPPTTDPRPAFAGALDRALEVLAAVDVDDVHRPTPCTELDVERLSGHLVGVIRRVAAVARGEDAMSVPTFVTGMSPTGAVEAFAAGRSEQEAAWADDGVLGRPLVLPFATLPGSVALSIYIAEITVHTWDLATAIGATVTWDDTLVEGALATMHAGLPAEPRGAETGIPFGEVVPVAADAPAIDRLVAWMGRRPDWVA